MLPGLLLTSTAFWVSYCVRMQSPTLEQCAHLSACVAARCSVPVRKQLTAGCIAPSIATQMLPRVLLPPAAIFCRMTQLSHCVVDAGTLGQAVRA